MNVTEPPVAAEVRGPSALFSFDGRINRGTFWKIAVLNFLFGTVATIIGTRGFGREAFHGNAVSVSLTILLGAITAWQSFATQVKRWHDLNKAGTMALLSFIPGLNFLVFLYLGSQEGSTQPNEYGDAPHDISLW